MRARRVPRQLANSNIYIKADFNGIRIALPMKPIKTCDEETGECVTASRRWQIADDLAPQTETVVVEFTVGATFDESEGAEADAIKAVFAAQHAYLWIDDVSIEISGLLTVTVSVAIREDRGVESSHVVDAVRDHLGTASALQAAFAAEGATIAIGADPEIKVRLHCLHAQCPSIPIHAPSLCPIGRLCPPTDRAGSTAGLSLAGGSLGEESDLY